MANAPQAWADDEGGEIDLSGVSKAGPPPLDDGVYQATIEEARAAGTKPDPKTGKVKPAFEMTLTVTRKHGEPEGSLNRTIFDKIVLTEKAGFRVVQLNDATETRFSGKTNMAAVEEYCAELVGKTVWLRSRQEEYNGKVRAKVAAYLTEAEAAEVAAGRDPYAKGEDGDRPVRRGRGGGE